MKYKIEMSNTESKHHRKKKQNKTKKNKQKNKNKQTNKQTKPLVEFRGVDILTSKFKM